MTPWKRCGKCLIFFYLKIIIISVEIHAKYFIQKFRTEQIRPSLVKCSHGRDHVTPSSNNRSLCLHLNQETFTRKECWESTGFPVINTLARYKINNFISSYDTYAYVSINFWSLKVLIILLFITYYRIKSHFIENNVSSEPGQIKARASPNQIN